MGTEREMNYRLEIRPSPSQGRGSNTLLPLVYVVRSLKGGPAETEEEPPSKPTGYPNTFATCSRPIFTKVPGEPLLK